MIQLLTHTEVAEILISMRQTFHNDFTVYFISEKVQDENTCTHNMPQYSRFVI